VNTAGVQKIFSTISLCRDEGRRLRALCVLLLVCLGNVSCATVQGDNGAVLLRQTASLIEEVKSFGRTLGIEPTEALSRSSRDEAVLSMLWLWMQREGTLALTEPMDIRLAVGYGADKERVKIEQVYRVDRYSVYYRQGNEFADARSVATVGFAEEPMVRRVKVILHEDLHGDINFDLPWEVEEAIVTPLGSLAAAEYFRWKGDVNNFANAMISIAEERELSLQLNALAMRAAAVFAFEKNVEVAKEKILGLLPEYPAYQKQFERQVRGQHAATALEAKLSHDLAYYRFFDVVAELARAAPSLKVLIQDLKRLPRDSSAGLADKFFGDLQSEYGVTRR
jgi:hypothetical protein